MDQVITDPVFVTLAARPNLETLKLHKPITASLVSKAFEEQIQRRAGGNLFPKLHTLGCTGEPEAFTRLSPYLFRLTHLEANIECRRNAPAEVQDCVVQTITISCPNLQALTVRYLGPKVGNIPSQALVNLAQRNSQLKELRIAGVKVERFGDPYFISMIRALPQLECLVLEFQCNLTAAALIEVVKNCGTTLVEFEIWATFDLRNLADTDLSFSELTSFTIGKLVRPASSVVEGGMRIGRLLKKLAPKLTDINSKFNSAFTDQVLDEVFTV